MIKRVCIVAGIGVVLLGVSYGMLLQLKNTERIGAPESAPTQETGVKPAPALMPSESPATSAAESETPSSSLPAEAASRQWAVRLDQPPLTNFHRVDASLYRGAQPDAAGMQALEKMGIKTIINLRTLHDDDKETRATALRREHIRMIATNISEDDAVDFLQIVTKKENGPFFVHCQHGSDRTGAMCAVYRVVVQGWPLEEALREMMQGGYGFHEIWKKTILPDLRKLDFDRIRERLKL